MPLSPLATHGAELGPKGLDGQFDILRDGGQEAALIPSDRVSRHTELCRKFALSETEEEPLFPKLPIRQPGDRLPVGAFQVKTAAIPALLGAEGPFGLPRHRGGARLQRWRDGRACWRPGSTLDMGARGSAA
jgi:hypothetical protein